MDDHHLKSGRKFPARSLILHPGLAGVCLFMAGNGEKPTKQLHRLYLAQAGKNIRSYRLLIVRELFALRVVLK
jgi:hypothetical protein